MGTVIINKEKTINEMEKLYTNLRDVISKHPGPEIAINFNATQKSLRNREEEMKVSVKKFHDTTIREESFKYFVTRVS